MSSPSKQKDIQLAYNWWSEHRSKAQADRRYAGFARVIAELSESADLHAQSRERNRFAVEIRDLLFGLGRRPTHRAVFTIRGDEAVVLTVRHLAQRDLSPDDIES